MGELEASVLLTTERRKGRLDLPVLLWGTREGSDQGQGAGHKKVALEALTWVAQPLCTEGLLKLAFLLYVEVEPRLAWSISSHSLPEPAPAALPHLPALSHRPPLLP